LLFPENPETGFKKKRFWLQKLEKCLIWLLISEYCSQVGDSSVFFIRHVGLNDMGVMSLGSLDRCGCERPKTCF
jgi:hypothetical protein